MSADELAEWFGIKKKTYLNARKTKLEELKLFADFEEIRGGVNILSIKIPTYVKQGSRAYNIIKEKLCDVWHKSGYDTAARVGSQIWRQNEELQKLISEDTAKSYASRVRTEYYGRVYMDEKGSKGSCWYAYVRCNDWEEAILLTPEQTIKLNALRRTIYCNEQEPLVYEAYRKGEITQAEYEDFMQQWKDGAETRYVDFMEGVAQLLGFYPSKVTKVENEINFADAL